MPGAWEDLADIDLIVICFPVFVLHPPVAIVLELVVELLPKFGLVIPSLVFITESTVPLGWTWTPRVPNTNKL